MWIYIASIKPLIRPLYTHLQFTRQHVSPLAAIADGIERTVHGCPGVFWDASFVVGIRHVDLVVDDGDAVRIVQTGLENRWVGAVKARFHNTRCLTPVRVIQIPVTPYRYVTYCSSVIQVNVPLTVLTVFLYMSCLQHP